MPDPSTRPNIELRGHDIVADELEPGAFDLAHERLVLQHLPERGQALGRMIGALQPGGWLLIEDFDRGWLPLTPACEQGLSEVQVEAHTGICACGSPGCRLHRSNIEQLQDRVTDVGQITPEETERFYKLIEDPSFSVNSYMLVSARGRRPRTD